MLILVLALVFYVMAIVMAVYNRDLSPTFLMVASGVTLFVLSAAKGLL